MSTPAPQATRSRTPALAVAVLACALVSSLLAPAIAASKPTPTTVSLRLASASKTERLVAPGLAMSRATRTLLPGQSLTFSSEPLRRPVSVNSRPFVRLHLAHTVPGDVVLYLSIQAVGPEGSVRVLLPSHAVTALESLMSQGAAANVDFRLPHVVGSLAPHEQLQLSISELGGSPLGAAHPDVLTVYLGALPGEDTDVHDLGQVNDEAKGGKNPARLSLSVTGTGPFQQW
ncbi:MAG: type transport system ATP-binding protein [Frankiaceae bacterium]|nr:type transport system ATP-binding protein [Frankiaceae bacterium]